MAIDGKNQKRGPAGIVFGRVLTVLMTLPDETLEKIIERSEAETLHSPEQQELRAKRLNALKESL